MSAQDVVVPQGLFHVPVPIVATRAGAFANTPTGLTSQGQPFGNADIQLADTLFDKGFSVQSATSAGGSDGVTDDVLRAAAQAYAVGRYAPTVGADVSWASSPSWRAVIQTAVQGEGFGLRAVVFDGVNAFVRVKADVTLRREANVTDYSDVTAALTTAATAYFTARPDWYTWRARALRSALTRAHRSILACTKATVIDAAPTGDPLSEPPAVPNLATGAIHWALAPGAVEVTFN